MTGAATLGVLAGGLDSPRPPISDWSFGRGEGAVVWLIYLLVLAVLGTTAYRLLPADLRLLIGENCRDSRRRLRSGYTARELVSVFHFYGWAFLVV